MSTSSITDATRHELACRVNGGLEIALFWETYDNSTTIDVHQASTEETLSFRVPPARALDAFHHPFAYLAHQIRHFVVPDNIDDLLRDSP